MSLTTVKFIDTIELRNLFFKERTDYIYVIHIINGGDNTESRITLIKDKGR